MLNLENKEKPTNLKLKSPIFKLSNTFSPVEIIVFQQHISTKILKKSKSKFTVNNCAPLKTCELFACLHI